MNNIFLHMLYSMRLIFSPSLPLLKQWLPVTYQIKFNLSTLTYRALSTQQPPYLASLLHLSGIPRQLRSSISQQLIVPKTNVNLDKRAFSVTETSNWNELLLLHESIQARFKC